MPKDTRTAFGQMFDQQRETNSELSVAHKRIAELEAAIERHQWNCEAGYISANDRELWAELKTQ